MNNKNKKGKSMMRVKPPTSNCSCQTCQAMCMSSPCLPTPAEAMKIFAHFPNKVSRTLWVNSYTKQTHLVIMPLGVPEKHELDRGSIILNRCTFFDKESGKCMLHAMGLKPLEGKIMHHSMGAGAGSVVRQLLIDSFWTTPKAKEVKAFFGIDSIEEGITTRHQTEEVIRQTGEPDPKQVKTFKEIVNKTKIAWKAQQQPQR